VLVESRQREVTLRSRCRRNFSHSIGFEESPASYQLRWQHSPCCGVLRSSAFLCSHARGQGGSHW
jgi:hypothetical protein